MKCNLKKLKGIQADTPKMLSDINVQIKNYNFTSDKADLIKGKLEEKLSDSEEIYRALVLGTRDYMTKNGFTRNTLKGTIVS